MGGRADMGDAFARNGLAWPHMRGQGARVNPDWLLRFLKDPSQAAPAERASLAQAVSGHAQTGGDDWAESLGLHAQPGVNRNGVRRYLKARMPTFNFSPNELQALVNFFMGASSPSLSAEAANFFRSESDVPLIVGGGFLPIRLRKSILPSIAYWPIPARFEKTQ